MGKDRRDAGTSHCISVMLTVLEAYVMRPKIDLLAEALRPHIKLD